MGLVEGPGPKTNLPRLQRQAQTKCNAAAKGSPKVVRSPKGLRCTANPGKVAGRDGNVTIFGLPQNASSTIEMRS